MSCTSDKHFASLVKALKSNNGFLHFSHITKWYNENYLTVDDKTVHAYVPSIVLVLTAYIDDNGFMDMFDLVSKLVSVGHMVVCNAKFVDLDNTMNSDIKYRILAEICGKLIYTEWKRIPGYDTL